MSQKEFLTPEQSAELKERLAYLKNVAIPQNAEEIKAALQLGDLSENAEFDSAKEEQAKLNFEMEKINRTLANSIVIQQSGNKDQVEIGHTVTLLFIEQNLKKSLRLLGKWDEKVTSTSIESPLGSNLLGKKVGDRFTTEAPNDLPTHKYTVEVLSID
jgi:transcription elongation factor GreA